MNYLKLFLPSFKHSNRTFTSMKLFEPDVVTKKATFGMSWFWFPEAQFGAAPGIIRTKVGYAGGTKLGPTYHSLGDHTETIEVDYDPSKTDYNELLKIFWKNHDPTSKCSRQYMSAIFFHDEEQQRLAIGSQEKAKADHRRPITTKIIPATEFYDAEDYHQKYLLQRHSALCRLLPTTPTELTRSHVLARINGYVGGYGEMADFEAECPKWGLGEEAIEYVRDAMVGGKRGFFWAIS